MARLAISPLVVAALWLACGPSRAPRQELSPEGIRLITAEQIEASGARSAWEALQRTVPNYSFRETSSGTPVRIDHRGRSSVLLSEAPQIVLDGVRIADFRVLDQIPASDVLTIEVLSGLTGTTYHGTNANNGVIRIRTRTGA